MDILHITESLGGGVATAMMQYVKSAPQHKHFLLATVRQSAKVDAALDEYFSNIYDLPAGSRSAIKAIRSTFQTINPDKVHLHSSYAGAYGRLSGLPREKIIYTPHCFAFERTDLSIPVRAAIYAVEQLLSLGGAEIAGVSPREAALGKRMIGVKRSTFLPNSSDFKSDRRDRIETTLTTIATSGRLCIQKDPDFFARVAKIAMSKNPLLKFVWFGGGDTQYERTLVECGVKVTGWLEHAKVAELLEDVDAYLHTASWEGNPMSIIEAASLQLPIYARNIKSLKSLGLKRLANTEAELAEEILKASNEKNWSAGAKNAEIVNMIASKPSQIASLATIYR